MKENFRYLIFICLGIICSSLFAFPSPSLAVEEKIPIVVDGDHVEYFNDERKITATGNVRIEYKETKLFADSVVVYSATKDIVAEGNVKLQTENGTLVGNKILYNFENKTGSIVDADIETAPFYAKSSNINKVSDRELMMRRGYLTTCDLSDPHWRLVAKQVLIFPEDRVVAKNVSIIIGNITVATLPQYVHVLSDKRPRVTVVPGHDKEWGYYLLTAWRYYFNEGLKGRVHLDYRERKKFAEGVDLSYAPPDMGTGLLRTYFMHERAIEAKHIWQEDEGSIEKRDRYMVEWRHKWQIDSATNLLWQYNKFKDDQFLYDYFRREYEIDKAPNTYAQFTHAESSYLLNVLVEKRVNNFFSAVEKLPQVKFEMLDSRIGESNFYVKSYNDFSRLIQQDAGGTVFNDPITRLDTFNNLTYPFRFSVIDVSPTIGFRETYYSQDLYANHNRWRGIFYAGSDFSTRFFRIYNVKGNFLGMDINQLRHLVNPTIKYSYIKEPSIDNSDLRNFDEIDAISKSNSANIAIENKLQTKLEGKSVDLVRHILSSDYIFRGNNINGRLSDIIKSELELRPRKGFTIDVDTDYDRQMGSVFTNHTDFYFSQGDKYSIGLGHYYQKDEDDQLTSEVSYRFSPIWKIRVYERFDFTGKGLREQQYVLTRDLHCWIMEASYHVDRGRGESIWLKFNLKAFPELGFEFDTTYHQPKTGSQSYE